jgi:hypothetical protein
MSDSSYSSPQDSLFSPDSSQYEHRGGTTDNQRITQAKISDVLQALNNTSSVPTSVSTPSSQQIPVSPESRTMYPSDNGVDISNHGTTWTPDQSIFNSSPDESDGTGTYGVSTPQPYSSTGVDDDSTGRWDLSNSSPTNSGHSENRQPNRPGQLPQSTRNIQPRVDNRPRTPSRNTPSPLTDNTRESQSVSQRRPTQQKQDPHHQPQVYTQPDLTTTQVGVANLQQRAQNLLTQAGNGGGIPPVDTDNFNSSSNGEPSNSSNGDRGRYSESQLQPVIIAGLEQGGPVQSSLQALTNTLEHLQSSSATQLGTVIPLDLNIIRPYVPGQLPQPKGNFSTLGSSLSTAQVIAGGIAGLGFGGVGWYLTRRGKLQPEGTIDTGNLLSNTPTISPADLIQQSTKNAAQLQQSLQGTSASSSTSTTQTSYFGINGLSPLTETFSPSSPALIIPLVAMGAGIAGYLLRQKIQPGRKGGIQGQLLAPITLSDIQPTSPQPLLPTQLDQRAIVSQVKTLTTLLTRSGGQEAQSNTIPRNEDVSGNVTTTNVGQTLTQWLHKLEAFLRATQETLITESGYKLLESIFADLSEIITNPQSSKEFFNQLSVDIRQSLSALGTLIYPDLQMELSPQTMAMVGGGDATDQPTTILRANQKRGTNQVGMNSGSGGGPGGKKVETGSTGNEDPIDVLIGKVATAIKGSRDIAPSVLTEIALTISRLKTGLEVSQSKIVTNHLSGIEKTVAFKLLAISPKIDLTADQQSQLEVIRANTLAAVEKYIQAIVYLEETQQVSDIMVSDTILTARENGRRLAQAYLNAINHRVLRRKGVRGDRVYSTDLLVTVKDSTVTDSTTSNSGITYTVLGQPTGIQGHAESDLTNPFEIVYKSGSPVLPALTQLVAHLSTHQLPQTLPDAELFFTPNDLMRFGSQYLQIFQESLVESEFHHFLRSSNPVAIAIKEFYIHHYPVKDGNRHLEPMSPEWVTAVALAEMRGGSSVTAFNILNEKRFDSQQISQKQLRIYKDHFQDVIAPDKLVFTRQRDDVILLSSMVQSVNRILSHGGSLSFVDSNGAIVCTQIQAVLLNAILIVYSPKIQDSTVDSLLNRIATSSNQVQEIIQIMLQGGIDISALHQVSDIFKQDSVEYRWAMKSSKGTSDGLVTVKLVKRRYRNFGLMDGSEPIIWQENGAGEKYQNPSRSFVKSGTQDGQRYISVQVPTHSLKGVHTPGNDSPTDDEEREFIGVTTPQGVGSGRSVRELIEGILAEHISTGGSASEGVVYYPVFLGEDGTASGSGGEMTILLNPKTGEYTIASPETTPTQSIQADPIDNDSSQMSTHNDSSVDRSPFEQNDSLGGLSGLQSGELLHSTPTEPDLAEMIEIGSILGGSEPTSQPTAHEVIVESDPEQLPTENSPLALSTLTESGLTLQQIHDLPDVEKLIEIVIAYGQYVNKSHLQIITNTFPGIDRDTSVFDPSIVQLQLRRIQDLVVSKMRTGEMNMLDADILTKAYLSFVMLTGYYSIAGFGVQKQSGLVVHDGYYQFMKQLNDIAGNKNRLFSIENMREGEGKGFIAINNGLDYNDSIRLALGFSNTVASEDQTINFVVASSLIIEGRNNRINYPKVEGNNGAEIDAGLVELHRSLGITSEHLNLQPEVLTQRLNSVLNFFPPNSDGRLRVLAWMQKIITSQDDAVGVYSKYAINNHFSPIRFPKSLLNVAQGVRNRTDEAAAMVELRTWLNDPKLIDVRLAAVWLLRGGVDTDLHGIFKQFVDQIYVAGFQEILSIVQPMTPTAQPPTPQSAPSAPVITGIVTPGENGDSGGISEKIGVEAQPEVHEDSDFDKQIFERVMSNPIILQDNPEWNDKIRGIVSNAYEDIYDEFFDLKDRLIDIIGDTIDLLSEGELRCDLESIEKDLEQLQSGARISDMRVMCRLISTVFQSSLQGDSASDALPAKLFLVRIHSLFGVSPSVEVFTSLESILNEIEHLQNADIVDPAERNKGYFDDFSDAQFDTYVQGVILTKELFRNPDTSISAQFVMRNTHWREVIQAGRFLQEKESQNFSVVLGVIDSILNLNEYRAVKIFDLILETPEIDLAVVSRIHALVLNILYDYNNSRSLDSIIHNIELLIMIEGQFGIETVTRLYGINRDEYYQIATIRPLLLLQMYLQIGDDYPEEKSAYSVEVSLVTAILALESDKHRIYLDDWRFEVDQEHHVRIFPADAVQSPNGTMMRNTLQVVANDLINTILGSTHDVVKSINVEDLRTITSTQLEQAFHLLQGDTPIEQTALAITVLPDDLRMQFISSITSLQCLIEVVISHGMETAQGNSIAQMLELSGGLLTPNILFALGEYFWVTIKAETSDELKKLYAPIGKALELVNIILFTQQSEYLRRVYGTTVSEIGIKITQINKKLKPFNLEVLCHNSTHEYRIVPVGTTLMGFTSTNKGTTNRTARAGFGQNGKSSNQLPQAKNPFADFKKLKGTTDELIGKLDEQVMQEPAADQSYEYEPSTDYITWIGELSSELLVTLSPETTDQILDNLLDLAPLIERFIDFNFQDFAHLAVENISDLLSIITSNVNGVPFASRSSNAAAQLLSSYTSTNTKLTNFIEYYTQRVNSSGNTDGYRVKIEKALCGLGVVTQIIATFEVYRSVINSHIPDELNRYRNRVDELLTLINSSFGSSITIKNNIVISGGFHIPQLLFLLGENNVANPERCSQLQQWTSGLKDFADEDFPLSILTPRLRDELSDNDQLQVVSTTLDSEREVQYLDLAGAGAILHPKLDRLFSTLKITQRMLVPIDGSSKDEDILPEPSLEYRDFVSELAVQLQSTLSPDSISGITSGLVSISPLIESFVGFDLTALENKLQLSLTASFEILANSNNLNRSELLLLSSTQEIFNSDMSSLLRRNAVLRGCEGYDAHLDIAFNTMAAVLMYLRLVIDYQRLAKSVNGNPKVTLQRHLDALFSHLNFANNPDFGLRLSGLNSSRAVEASVQLVHFIFSNNISNPRVFIPVKEHYDSVLKVKDLQYPFSLLSPALMSKVADYLRSKEDSTLPFVTDESSGVTGLDFRGLGSITDQVISQYIDHLSNAQAVFIPTQLPKNPDESVNSNTPSAEYTHYLNELSAQLQITLPQQSIEVIISGLDSISPLVESMMEVNYTEFKSWYSDLNFAGRLQSIISVGTLNGATTLVVERINSYVDSISKIYKRSELFKDGVSYSEKLQYSLLILCVFLELMKVAGSMKAMLSSLTGQPKASVESIVGAITAKLNILNHPEFNILALNHSRFTSAILDLQLFLFNNNIADSVYTTLKAIQKPSEDQDINLYPAYLFPEDFMEGIRESLQVSDNNQLPFIPGANDSDKAVDFRDISGIVTPKIQGHIGHLLEINAVFMPQSHTDTRRINSETPHSKYTEFREALATAFDNESFAQRITEIFTSNIDVFERLSAISANLVNYVRNSVLPYLSSISQVETEFAIKMKTIRTNLIGLIELIEGSSTPDYFKIVSTLYMFEEFSLMYKINKSSESKRVCMEFVTQLCGPENSDLGSTSLAIGRLASISKRLFSVLFSKNFSSLISTDISGFAASDMQVNPRIPDEATISKFESGISILRRTLKDHDLTNSATIIDQGFQTSPMQIAFAGMFKDSSDAGRVANTFENAATMFLHFESGWDELIQFIDTVFLPHQEANTIHPQVDLHHRQAIQNSASMAITYKQSLELNGAPTYFKNICRLGVLAEMHTALEYTLQTPKNSQIQNNLIGIFCSGVQIDQLSKFFCSIGPIIKKMFLAVVFADTDNTMGYVMGSELEKKFQSFKSLNILSLIQPEAAISIETTLHQIQQLITPGSTSYPLLFPQRVEFLHDDLFKKYGNALQPDVLSWLAENMALYEPELEHLHSRRGEFLALLPEIFSILDADLARLNLECDRIRESQKPVDIQKKKKAKEISDNLYILKEHYKDTQVASRLIIGNVASLRMLGLIHDISNIFTLLKSRDGNQTMLKLHSALGLLPNFQIDLNILNGSENTLHLLLLRAAAYNNIPLTEFRAVDGQYKAAVCRLWTDSVKESFKLIDAPELLESIDFGEGNEGVIIAHLEPLFILLSAISQQIVLEEQGSTELVQSQMYSDLLEVYNDSNFASRMGLIFLKSANLFEHLNKVVPDLIRFANDTILPHISANIVKLGTDDLYVGIKGQLLSSSKNIEMSMRIIDDPEMPDYFRNIALLSLVCESYSTLKILTVDSQKNTQIKINLTDLLFPDTSSADMSIVSGLASDMQKTLFSLFDYVLIQKYRSKIPDRYIKPRDIRRNIDFYQELDNLITGSDTIAQFEAKITQFSRLLSRPQSSDNQESIDIPVDQTLVEMFTLAMPPRVAEYLSDGFEKYGSVLERLDNIVPTLQIAADNISAFQKSCAPRDVLRGLRERRMPGMQNTPREALRKNVEGVANAMGNSLEVIQLSTLNEKSILEKLHIAITILWVLRFALKTQTFLKDISNSNIFNDTCDLLGIKHDIKDSVTNLAKLEADIWFLCFRMQSSTEVEIGNPLNFLDSEKVGLILQEMIEGRHEYTQNLPLTSDPRNSDSHDFADTNENVVALNRVFEHIMNMLQLLEDNMV